MSKLAIIQLDDYRQDDLYRAFQLAFQELELAAVFKANEEILIKPNLLSAVVPEQAVTPHPTIFEALIRCLRAYQIELSYGDSPAFDTTDRASQMSGLAAIAELQGVPLADFINVTEVALPEAKLMRRLPLAEGVAAADGLVSLAKLKTHALTGMTGILKNQFGVIPGKRKASYHANFPDVDSFSQMIVDINRYIQPRLSVMDGIMAMEGNGPRNGRPRKVGVILISTDPVAVDAAGAFLIGLEPGQIVTTKLAADSGLGEMNLNQIAACLIKPDRSVQSGQADQLLSSLRVMDFAAPVMTRPAFKALITLGVPFFKRRIQSRPTIKPESCIRCGICEQGCPLTPPAVRQKKKNQVPRFDYARCIRCFCCQEICPVGAIEVQKTRLGQLFKT